jgi:hypothetical protein
MSDEIKLKTAQNVFQTLCTIFDEKKFKYEKHPDDLIINFSMSTEDLPILFVLNVDAERQLIRLHSPIPVLFEGDSRKDGAVAACQANYQIADGSFDFDYKQGKVVYRITSSFIDSLISRDVFEYLISFAFFAVDKYNDKFFMLAKGKADIEEFFKRD